MGQPSFVLLGQYPITGYYVNLKESIRLAQCLVDDFAGKSAVPHQLEIPLDWRSNGPP